MFHICDNQTFYRISTHNGLLLSCFYFPYDEKTVHAANIGFAARLVSVMTMNVLSLPITHSSGINSNELNPLPSSSKNYFSFCTSLSVTQTTSPSASPERSVKIIFGICKCKFFMKFIFNYSQLTRYLPPVCLG
jgi:hypothetical protein